MKRAGAATSTQSPQQPIRRLLVRREKRGEHFLAFAAVLSGYIMRVCVSIVSK